MMRLGLSGNKAPAEIALWMGVMGWAPNAIAAEKAVEEVQGPPRRGLAVLVKRPLKK
jgi:hypothetical protein